MGSGKRWYMLGLILVFSLRNAFFYSSNVGNLSLPQSSLDFKTLVDLTVLTYISGLGTLSFSDSLDITQYSLCCSFSRLSYRVVWPYKRGTLTIRGKTPSRRQYAYLAQVISCNLTFWLATQRSDYG